MVRQIGHAVDMRVNRLSLMRIDRRFRKPDLLAVRTLALQLFRMALGVIGALQRLSSGAGSGAAGGAGSGAAATSAGVGLFLYRRRVLTIKPAGAHCA